MSDKRKILEEDPSPFIVEFLGGVTISPNEEGESSSEPDEGSANFDFDSIDFNDSEDFAGAREYFKPHSS